MKNQSIDRWIRSLGNKSISQLFYIFFRYTQHSYSSTVSYTYTRIGVVEIKEPRDEKVKTFYYGLKDTMGTKGSLKKNWKCKDVVRMYVPKSHFFLARPIIFDTVTLLFSNRGKFQIRNLG